MLKNNYYFSSFFWSTLQKILNAILGFISVPLLLGYYGKAEYGILAIATACNGYMHLLDLGMNTGAIKFFSQWKAEGKQDLICRVARTNITFYILIACVNMFGLVALAVWGESIFSVTHEQFLQLRMCLFIIALFSIFSWAATTFNQLLVADKQMAYTMQVQCVQTIFKTLLIFVVLWAHLSLTVYFFWLTVILALLLMPYAIKCRRDNLIDSLKPAAYWKDFRIVLSFSLSIFALSLFQMTATQSRPIILSIFSANGAETVSEYRIIEVIPQLIIMIGGTFSGIFLPKTSELIAKANQKDTESFIYNWTIYTSIIACVLCFPFILNSQNILSAYVGAEYGYLSIWLVIWIICTLAQIHSTPANALILAFGKVKILVLTSAISCFISMIVNALFSQKYGVGSAIVGYSCYIIIVLVVNYFFYYRYVLCLSLVKMLFCFLAPCICGILSFMLSSYFADFFIFDSYSTRINYILNFCAGTFLWLMFFTVCIFSLRVIRIKNHKIISFYEYQKRN